MDSHGNWGLEGMHGVWGLLVGNEGVERKHELLHHEG